MSIAAQIARRIREARAEMSAQWSRSAPVRHCFVDDLLPREQVLSLYEQLPPESQLVRKESLREHKAVGVDLERYAETVGAHLLAFQDPEVVAAIAEVTGLAALEPDPSLYASGISLMRRGDFLNPHLDNSHDGDQRLYRALNLLFYITPDWRLENGGNLELWTPELKSPAVIESRFNRLVIMGTDDRSWHSVQHVVADRSRVCLSNYYFSAVSPSGYEYRNVTSFRGRPEDGWKRIVLRVDAAMLNVIGRMFPALLTRNKHRRGSARVQPD